ncbi:sigma-70 family RNA polymerase sigma factor [Streptomyces vinaceus]|uniref:hypothetical protein n=1 Tax=Streptomyces vinaceus TaxID=1960 RepID=UPI0036761D0A
MVDTTLTNRNLVPYYLTVVKNLAADEARAVRTAPILLAPDSLNCGVRLWAERIQDASELLDDLVIPAIRTMRPGQRRSVVEIQSQGADDTDISIALGIPRKQVQVQRVQAVKELRVKLRKSIRSRFHGGKEGAKPP